MHWAADYGHADILQLLASHGANVNAATKVLSTIIEIGLAARALLLFMVFLICVFVIVPCYFCVFGCVVGVIAVVFACRMATLL